MKLNITVDIPFYNSVDYIDWTKIERLKREYYMANKELESLVCPCPNF